MSVVEKHITETFNAYGHIGDPKYCSRYRNLIFTPAGYARMWHIIGYCQAAYDHGDEATKADATRLLTDLHDRLQYLNDFGGRLEGFNVPRYRVAVADDGCWGSFAIAWFHAIEPAKYYDWINDPANADKDFDEVMRCHDDMKIWTGEGYVRYGRAFHGGLILHSGYEPPIKGSYGIHT